MVKLKQPVKFDAEIDRDEQKFVARILEGMAHDGASLYKTLRWYMNWFGLKADIRDIDNWEPIRKG